MSNKFSSQVQGSYLCLWILLSLLEVDTSALVMEEMDNDLLATDLLPMLEKLPGDPPVRAKVLKADTGACGPKCAT